MVEQIDPAAYVPPPVVASGGTSNNARHQQQEQKRPQARPVVDIATVLGLPENVMPAPIQEAFLQLVEEVQRLRDEVERVRMHESYLLSASDRHAFLPALNRRAFLAGLTRILEASERGELPGSLAFIHIGGIEALRRQHGLMAGDAALAYVANAIQLELRQTDLLTYLDSSDFAVALAVANEEGTDAKIERITTAIMAAPLMWNEHKVELDPAVGIVHFQAGMTADQILNDAAQAMILGTSALSS